MDVQTIEKLYVSSSSTFQSNRYNAVSNDAKVGAAFFFLVLSFLSLNFVLSFSIRVLNESHLHSCFAENSEWNLAERKTE